MQFDVQRYNSGGYRILKHVVFWAAFSSFVSLVYGSFSDNYGRQFLLQLLYMPTRLVAAYITIYWLLPKLLLQEKYLQFLLSLVAVLILAGFVSHATYLFIEVPFFNGAESSMPLFYPAKILKSTIWIYPIVVVALVIKLFEHFYQNQKKTQSLAKDKLEAELKFLKSQIHPHFLFNTLNNLYALTLKKSSKAPELVLKLSDLLNYMLYECNARKVPLEKELDLLNNYLELERIRYGDRLSLNYIGNVDPNNHFIAPMLLLPFVENSFKHGVSGQLDKVWVHLKISLKEKTLLFEVENSKNHNGVDDRDGYTEGIGLKNVKRRLDLLYNGHYELDVQDNQDSYQVKLKLELDNDL